MKYKLPSTSYRAPEVWSFPSFQPYFLQCLFSKLILCHTSSCHVSLNTGFSAKTSLTPSHFSDKCIFILLVLATCLPPLWSLSSFLPKWSWIYFSLFYVPNVSLSPRFLINSFCVKLIFWIWYLKTLARNSFPTVCVFCGLMKAASS